MFTVAAITCGLLAAKLRHARMQSAAVARWNALGVSVAYEGEYRVSADGWQSGPCNHQGTFATRYSREQSGVRGLLSEYFGKDFVLTVPYVVFRGPSGPWTEDAIGYLKDISGLREVVIHAEQGFEPAAWNKLLETTGFERLTLIRDRLDPCPLAGLEKMQWLTNLAIEGGTLSPEDVAPISQLHSLRHLELHSIASSAELLEPLAGLRRLQSLRLSGLGPELIEPGEDDFRFLDGLGELRCLKLDWARTMSPSIARRIGRLKHLEVLWLNGTEISSAEVAEFSELKKLKELQMGWVPIGDDAIAHLADCHSLEKIELSFTQVTDKSLRYLTGLERLKELRLVATQITDAGVEVLVGLPRLETLMLNGTQITDAGLKRLSTVEGLKNLWIDGTHTTPRGVIDFVQSVSQCDVHTR